MSGKNGCLACKELGRMAVICPRDCSSSGTDQCLGNIRADGRVQCWHCGRWMPTGELLDWYPDEEATDD